MGTETAVSPLLATPSRVITAMRAEIVSDFGELASLADQWSRLWNDSPSATIFQSLPWMRAWWRAFGDGVQLCAPVIWNANEIVGILPLVRDHATVRFLGTPGADYCDVLCREELAPAVLGTAFRSLLKMRGWRTCHLDNLRDDSQLFRCSTKLPAEIQRRLHTLSGTRRSTLLLRGCRDDVIAAMRRKPALKRHRNKLCRAGSVSFRHLEQRAEARLLLDTLFQQHIERRAMVGGHSQFLSPAWQTFYAALVDELDPQDQLRFSVLELDGHPIACHFGFECRGSLVLYKPTFDTEFAALSPGDVLLDALLAYAGERQLDEVDFTIGREAYKEHFTNHTSELFVIALDRGRFSPHVRRVVRSLMMRLRGSAAVAVLKRVAAGGMKWLKKQCNKTSAALAPSRKGE